MKELVVAARGLDAAARRAILDPVAAGDPELRAEVEALLAQHDRASRFLDGTVLPLGEEVSGAQHAVPERIGPYRVRDRIAVGGMGVVHRAEQGQPARTVALKVLRADSLAPALVQRFHREIEVLDRLQSPGIAHLHEAGVHASELGEQPWFAMKLVDGRPRTWRGRGSGGSS